MDIRIQRGELNSDGTTDFDDVDPSVLAISDLAAYVATYPNGDRNEGDYDGDVEFGDINPFGLSLSGNGRGRACV